MKHEWVKDYELGIVCEHCGTYHYQSIEEEECPGHGVAWDVAVIFSILGLITIGVRAAFFGLGA